MNLLAILIALVCERLVSLRPELREPRALVRYVCGALRTVARRDPPAITAVILAASLPGLLVAAVSGVLGAVLHGLAYVLLAAVVLCLALGPRYLRREVAEYRAAAARDVCQHLHGVIAFLPARVLALTCGVAGSFGESFSGWRSYLACESDHFCDANDRLLVHAGRGALGARWGQGPDEAERAREALALAGAALCVRLLVIALLTLVEWPA